MTEFWKPVMGSNCKSTIEYASSVRENIGRDLTFPDLLTNGG